MDEATAASIVDEGPPRRDPQLHLDILVMIMEFFDPCTVFGKQHEEAERDLRSFALVCKAWRQAAHPVLFRHLIVLSDPGSELFFLRTAPRPYNVFLDLLRRPPQSCAYTRSFYFYREMENGYELPDRTPLPPLPAFLGHLPNLKNVELYNPPPLCSMDGTIELSSILPAAETRSLDVLTVTRCSIPFTECLFPLLHQFNKVKELDMKHVNYPIASLPPGTLIPNPKFREIELFDVDHCPGLLECLSYMIGNPSIDDDDASLHEASVPVGGDEGLQILSVNVHDDDSLTGLQNMLNQSSATLTSFILSRSRYQEG
ncbi:hypothetical protein BDW22DRAFT_1228265 [Trametopsis cervina]|nr:hypothetical protein BDW22DRAFT_1228265 [Trametopsis cervina]